MFELPVDARCAAALALALRGAREPLHGHDWHVTATISGDRLDADGLLCDFHAVETALREVVAPFQNQNLNALTPFSQRLHPTAENVAKYLADELTSRLAPILGSRARLSALRITEAPGCAAVYRPPLGESASWPL